MRTNRFPMALLSLGLAVSLRAGVTYHVDAARAGFSLNTGADWANAFTNLTDALNAARSNDQVWVATGTYRPTAGADRAATFPINGPISLYGGFTNGADFADRDGSRYPAILSGDIGVPGDNTDNCYNVVTATNSHAFTLDGLVIRDGYNVDQDTASTSLTKRGAGLVCWNAFPSNVVNCLFLNNHSKYMAGAFYAGGTDWLSGLLTTFSNCLFVGNASKGSGGALRVDHHYLLTITACAFYDNLTTGGEGGGGMFLRLESGGSKIEIDRCRFIGNRSSGAGGGLTCFHRSLYFLLRNCLLAGNTALSSVSAIRGGGGLAYDCETGQGMMRVENCTLAANYGRNGGGIAFPIYSRTTTNPLFVTNTVVWDNVSQNCANGNALYVQGDIHTARVSHVCFEGGLTAPAVTGSGAVADQGGNIAGNPLFHNPGSAGVWSAAALYDAATGQTTLTDTLANWPAGKLAGFCVNPQTGDRATGSHGQLFHIVSNTATTLTVWGNAAALGTAASPYAIRDFRLTGDSSCIDAGAFQSWMTGATDIGGESRLRGTAPDIGAYEYLFRGTTITVR